MKKKILQVLGATKGASNLLVLFIPSVDRDGKPVDQTHWVERALSFLGATFGGATAFPQARGVWRDDQRQGELVFDQPVIVNCYTSSAALEKHIDALRDFLVQMGQSTSQGAVGVVIDRDYLEIEFPLGSS